MMQITEDTPPDMLAGAMDLTVHLPTGRTVKMSIERSTPMMDLLVHITTAHHLQQSGHILQALAMSPTSEYTDKILPYKPNTPIGVLDTQHVKVVAKNRPISAIKSSTIGHQPFESTFRLQVHLPRNQLYVLRVSQNVYLGDVMRKVCYEKKLDLQKYEFRHPGNLDDVLNPKLTLSDYQITEVYVVLKGTRGLAQSFSSNDIMALRKEEERKQMQARTGGGVFSLIFKRGKTSMGTGSFSSENRSISPSHSDDSRSITPPVVQQQILTSTPQEIVQKPKPPQRKRRIAPKPPQQVDEQRKNSVDKAPSHASTISDVSETDSQMRKSDNGLTICHSRNSSDSSGYHEPSVLSDHCNTSLPRRPKNSVNEVVTEEIVCENKIKLNGNLSNMAVISKSSASIAGRKKKAAPPPPVVAPKAENVVTAPEKASPTVDASNTFAAETQDAASTTPRNKKPPRPSLSLQEESKAVVNTNPDIVKPTPQVTCSKQEIGLPISNTLENCLKDLESTSKVESRDTRSSPKVVLRSHSLESGVICNANTLSNDTYSNPVSCNNNAANQLCNMKLSTEILPVHIPNIPLEQTETDLAQHQSIDKIIEDINDIDWEFHIAPPPSEFRDASPTNNRKEVIEKVLAGPIDDVSKLESSVANDCDSAIGEDTKPMLNTLSLENLEKRKSLVYNREISTSLKIAQTNSNNSIDENDACKRSSMLNELEEVIQNGGSRSLTRHVEQPAFDSYLPNFKISTYNEPKSKINIFEDDTIRSKSEEIINSDDAVFKKPYEFNKSKPTSRNNFYVKHQNLGIVIRSESFSSNINWKPLNPVQRSKSQVALNKISDGEENKTEDNSLTKSNSLFDVSGLQSLEVMRVIQNKLNTPSNSVEELDDLMENDCTNNNNKCVLPKKEDVSTISPQSTELESTTNTKTYQYQGPPAINLSTWSERPKTKVSLKEDTDYRISTNNNNTDNTFIKSNNSIAIKINGTDSTVKQESGGTTVIKLGEVHSRSNSDIINHTSAVNYRKPLANINKIDKAIRPHSVSHESEFDISRVPIVRAVELKKSVTQVTNGNNRYSDVYRSSETIHNISNQPINDEFSSVQRVNSFAQNRQKIIGFQGLETGNDNTARSRKSWNVPSSYSTLPAKINLIEPPVKSCSYTPNSNVPFSQLKLKRIDSNKTISDTNNVALRNVVPNSTHSNNRYSTGSQFILKSNLCDLQSSQPPIVQPAHSKIVQPLSQAVKAPLQTVNAPLQIKAPPQTVNPPPPPMPRTAYTSKKPIPKNGKSEDPRDELLNSIRNFGGLKGLRHVKV